MDRRQMIKALGVLLGGAISPACQKALSVPMPDRMVTEMAYDSDQRLVVHRLSDLIIPATDTPGAKDAQVGDFIDYVVTVWYDDDERHEFLQGLQAFMGQAQRTGHPFMQRSETDQIALLTAAEANDPEQTGFFAKMKELTVVGYYTSEIGSTKERKYVPMPGRYDGYYKFASVGQQWAS